MRSAPGKSRGRITFVSLFEEPPPFRLNDGKDFSGVFWDALRDLGSSPGITFSPRHPTAVGWVDKNSVPLPRAGDRIPLYGEHLGTARREGIALGTKGELRLNRSRLVVEVGKSNTSVLDLGGWQDYLRVGEVLPSGPAAGFSLFALTHRYGRETISVKDATLTIGVSAKRVIWERGNFEFLAGAGVVRETRTRKIVGIKEDWRFAGFADVSHFNTFRVLAPTDREFMGREDVDIRDSRSAWRPTVSLGLERRAGKRFRFTAEAEYRFGKGPDLPDAEWLWGKISEPPSQRFRVVVGVKYAFGHKKHR